MNLIITKEMLDKVMDCIVRSIHPNYSYIQVNQLINELSKLKPVAETDKKTNKV